MSDNLKRILVTGANTGIGLALAKQLVADYGCHVYLGSRNAERGSRAVEDVKKNAGENVELLTIDVSDPASVESAAASLSQTLGSHQLYAIVNNAGTGISHDVAIPSILDTNARGPRRVVDSFLPLLHPTLGRIVNVGSGAGPMFFDSLATDDQKRRYVRPMSEDEIEIEISKIEGRGDAFGAYSGSKALLACYTMALAREHPALTISIVTPGYIKTNMTKGYGATKLPHEGTVSLRKCLFEDLASSGGRGCFWGSDGLRSPLHYVRNPGDAEYDGADPTFD
mmetsp:Transcript_35091/g.75781  ORF Transcript_35091/g.75781 Transcript_35091/m.75781 type:complete len:282 (+) Transcript_35091:59-904(+)